MSEKTQTDLPMIGSHPMDEEVAACSPKIYVSNEEKAILEAMRTLRERAIDLRTALDAGASDDERKRLEGELATLRQRRAELAVRREQAFKRKMIMLALF
jgi:predicted  nucleic acid-binding Zn-ribbon protein